jgi:hypothetical protein
LKEAKEADKLKKKIIEKIEILKKSEVWYECYNLFPVIGEQ